MAISIKRLAWWRRGRHSVPEAPVRRRGRRLTLLGFVLALAAAAVPVGVWAGTPGNDPGNGQWVGGEVLAPGPEELVLWKLPGTGGVYGTCIDANLAGPLHGPYRQAQLINDPVYAELNHLYASPSTSDVRLAELSALNSHQYDRVNRSTQWSYVVNNQGGLSVADAGAMLDRATQLAGPYTVSIALPSGVYAGPVNSAVVSVRSAAGKPVPGAVVSLSASNVALRAKSVTTNTAGQANIGFTAPKGTTTKYTLRASVQSWTDLALYTAPGEQTMLSAASPTTQTGAKSGAIVRDRPVNLVKAAVGDPSHTPVAGYTFRISDAKGKVVIASVVSGPSPVSLGRLTMGARYTATEIDRPANGTLYIPLQNTLDFTVPDGTAAWTVLAQDPRMPTPTLGTQVTSEHALVGASLTDVVTVSGNDGEDATIDAVLYGPVPPPPSGSCADVSLTAYRAAHAVHVLASVSGAIGQGNGVVRITGPAVTAAGCYGWAETLTLRPSGATASSPPNAPHESTLVSAPPHTKLVHPTPNAPTAPAPKPHTPQAVTSPPLAQTGVSAPVARTILLGLGLVAAGAAVMFAASRAGRRA